ncbi:hypothetical protein Q8G41_27285, partial [Klebsiella pneumoniae]|uniref:hypothetical protein n=1 Tax=Klebsiella pneumoniae TaxID=573 RepID=UPI003013F622
NRQLARLFEKRGNFGHAITLWQLVAEVAPRDVEAQNKSKELAACETIQKGGYDSGEQPALPLHYLSGTAGKTSNKKEEKPAERVDREAAPIL